MGNIPNFDSFGAIIPHFGTDKVKIWHGRRSAPAYTLIDAKCCPL